MSRYIDVSENAIKEIFKKLNHRNIYPKVSDEMILRNYLDEFPTADVVEVVRCKDCKWLPYIDERGFVDGDTMCPCINDDFYYSYIPNDDHYCSYGERRKDEHTD